LGTQRVRRAELDLHNRALPKFEPHGDLVRAEASYSESRGSAAPALLLRAAKALEPLDPQLARETYLDAWSSALFAGRLATAGSLHHVVEDTAPQLGGNLDANGHNVDFGNGKGITDDAGNEQLLFRKTDEPPPPPAPSGEGLSGLLEQAKSKILTYSLTGVYRTNDLRTEGHTVIHLNHQASSTHMAPARELRDLCSDRHRRNLGRGASAPDLALPAPQFDDT